MRWDALAGAAFAAFAFACVPASSAGGGATGGLYGRVVIYPAKPVCEIGTPCSRPAAGMTLLFSRHRRVVARVTTGKDGRYRVALAAGRYGVRVQHASRLGSGLSPRVVTAPRAGYKRVGFTYDIGIR